MTTRLAIIFIDALPHTTANALDAVGMTWSPVRSGVGYSVNAKAELFAGLLPDELGLLNEFSLNPEPKRNLYAWLHSADRFSTLSWFLRRVLRKVQGGQIDNIPFAQKGMFIRHGVAAYERSFGPPTVLDALEAKVRYSECAVGRDRDAAVLEGLRDAIATGAPRVFAAFPDLDRDLHERGFASAAFDERMAFYRVVLGEVCAAVPDVVVLSDHGMAQVIRVLDVWRPLAQLSRRDGSRYFIDSTMVRVWGDESGRIRDALRRTGLSILTEQERAAFAVASREFGDVIAIAPEGSVLSPNSYGRIRSFAPDRFAMHGYHPNTEAQVGTLGLSNALARQLSAPGELSTLGVHAMLRQVVGT